MRNNFCCLLLFLTFSLVTNAQNAKNKWSVGISFAGAKFSIEDAKVVGGQLANQSPRLNISRYIFKGLTLDAAFASAFGDKEKYTTFDTSLRYDFGTSLNNVVPYILLGGSFISAKKFTQTLNFGVGNTFWFTPKYGLNLQLMYKFSESRFESQKSHIYPSIGFVYSFGSRSINPRLWE